MKMVTKTFEKPNCAMMYEIEQAGQLFAMTIDEMDEHGNGPLPVPKRCGRANALSKSHD